MRLKQRLSITALLVLFVGTRLIQESFSYKVAKASTDPEMTHNKLVRLAIKKLKGFTNSTESDFTSGSATITRADLTAAVAEMETHLTAMVQGQTDADYDLGKAQILHKKVGRNSFSHFYNPETKQGFRAMAGVEEVEQAANQGILDSSLYQALGPAIGSNKIADWYYARALHFMSAGDTEKALHDISYSCHVIQDSTVPMHTTDCGAEKKKCQHGEYEMFVEENLMTDFPMTTTTMEELLTLSQNTPAETLENNAGVSHPLQKKAAEGSDSDREEVGNAMVALAIDTTAAMFLRFYIKHATDPTKVIVLRIDKVTMKGELTDERTSPDFRPFVQFSVGGEQTAGLVGDKKEVEPQKMLDGHGWMFVHKCTPEELTAGTVNIEFSVHDVSISDCGDDCGKPRQKLKIDGENEKMTVVFSLTGDAIVEGTTSGCDGSNCPDNSIEVKYTIGHSHMLKGVYVELYKADLSKLKALGVLVIALICAGGFVFISILSWCFCRHKKKKKNAGNQPVQIQQQQPGAAVVMTPQVQQPVQYVQQPAVQYVQQPVVYSQPMV